MSDLTVYYDLSSEEWSGLDATAKNDCAKKSLEVIERWQAWKRERKELTAIKQMSAEESKKRTISEAKMLSREIHAGIYDSNLNALVEALHIHEEELYFLCNVRLNHLASWAAKRWNMDENEAAHALRKVLPLFKGMSKGDEAGEVSHD